MGHPDGSFSDGRFTRRNRARWVALRLLSCLALIITGVVYLSVHTQSPASADTPFTYLNEEFTEGTFPPTSWTAPEGTWSSSCAVTAPATGCAAEASFTGGAVGLDQLEFNPVSGIPANVQNLTLSFYSDFSPDSTTSGDSVSVNQASVPGDTGDFNMLASIAGAGGSDQTGVPVLHTVALPNDNLPLSFRWTSFGDTSSASSETWAISNVTITGTVPAPGYSLTANRVENTDYPHIVAGNPVTIRLSGSSDPTGDVLQFSISTPPTLGTLGPITQVDNTDATVVYTTPATACPDPDGISGFTCADPFFFTVHDAEGNVSAPAQVDINILPGGASGQVPEITAPLTEQYETISHNAQLVQGADLSSAVSVGPGAYPDEVELDVQASTGNIDLNNAVVSNVSFLNGTASGDQQIDLAGSVQHLNEAVGEFLYFPPSGTTPTATITLSARDLGPTGSGPASAPVTETVTINGIVNNPPPLLSLPTSPLSIATNAGTLAFPAGLSSGISLTDTGASLTTEDEVTLSVSGGTLALPTSDTSGPTQLVTEQSSGGGSSLDLTGTVAQLNEALPDLTFDPSGLPSETVVLSASAVDPDTQLSTSQESVDISVVEAPFAFGATSFTALEGTSSTFWLCASGPPGDPLTFTITTSTASGTLVADPSASSATSGCSQTLGLEAYIYTPNPGYTGSDSFTYAVTDNVTGLVSFGNTVSITVVMHQRPTAFDVSASTQEDTPVDVVLCAENPESGSSSLTFTITGGPLFGTLTDLGTPSVNPCNQGNTAETFAYSPNQGTFTSDGTDTFDYFVSDGTVSAPATGTINVTTLTPQVIGYSATVNEDSSIGLNLCATAPEGPITFTMTSPPQHGTLDQEVASGNGPSCPSGYFNFGYERYSPDQLYSGSDQIGFQATDGTRTSVEDFIDITVEQVEIPPTANSQTVQDIAPHPVDITLTGTSLQGSPLTYRVTGNPQHGTLSGTAPDLIYTPSISSGTDTFSFVTNDGTADSQSATVTVDITTPQLSSNVCYAGSQLNLNQYNCSGYLTSVADPLLGTVELAHTSGVRGSELRLQEAITNQSAVSDAVTITGPGSTADWPVLYDFEGGDDTSQVTGSGLTTTLGPAGSNTATAYLQIIVFTPFNQPAPATVSVPVLAVSGNNADVSTVEPIEVQNGTSTPTLALAQADGSGGATFPNSLGISPPLYNGGPAGGVDIEAGMSGTGVNSFLLQAQVEGGSTSGVTPTFFLASLNVTSAVLAGTEVITCYAGPESCPPLRAVLTPGSGSGYFSFQVTLTSTIDGQTAFNFASVQLAGSVGPDLYTINPDNGIGVFESTPATQIVSRPTELSGSASQEVFLQNDGDVSDTFSVRAAIAEASGDTSSLSVAATQPGFYGDLGNPVDVTTALKNGSYSVTIPQSDAVEFFVTDNAGPTTAASTPNVILTATSQLDPNKIDSYEVTFPTYFYRPDAVLTGPDGLPIGANVYQQTYLGPNGNNQEAEYDVDQAPTTIDVTLADRGQGAWPSGDAVVVKAPNQDSNFDVSYALLQHGTSTDVTAAITGSGLDLTLPTPGSPTPVIAMSVAASTTALAGHPGWYPISVTSQSTLPSGLADVVVVGLYNTGQSELRLAGLPQPEPSDITQMVSDDGLTNRVPPLPSAGYEPGVTYGAYSDPTGQKFAYVSTYDTFDLQVASEKVSPTPYRIQMVDPGPTLAGLPTWERDVFTSPYFNGPLLDTPADPLAAGSSINPTFTVGGENVTSALEGGTYTTPALGTNQTLDLQVSFSPPPGSSERYTPLKFNLINADTGELEDVLVLDPSSIVSCSTDGNQQQQATISTPTGPSRLNFEAFNRQDPGSTSDCMQQLTHSWITTAPVVFGSFVPATASTLAGGNTPTGLWLVPQAGTILRIDTDTLTVTGSNVSAYVDSPILDSDGTVDTAVAASGYAHYYYLGNYQELTWSTTDPTNGIEVSSNTTLPPSPFPLIKPSTSDWPNNTMTANRYFQVDGVDGTPVMVGEMDVDTPWYQGDIPLVMELNATDGLDLNYAAPSQTTMNLPGDDSVSFYDVYWTTNDDGTVVQGGCLGIPGELYTVLGLGSGGPSLCLLGATVTFEPISQTPGAEAKVSKITVQLMNPGIGVKGSPEFNINSFSGEIDLDPTTEDVTKVVLDPVFGVGPPTPCQLSQNNGLVTGLSKVPYLACPTNYFFFNAKITYQQGGFDNGNKAGNGFGLQFSGTLTFLNAINLANVEADISTSPFNFHFADSPIDLSISPSIPVSANVTFSGDVGANGFDIDVSGGISVDGVNILSASGVLSTIGIGVCGGALGVSIGFGDTWGDAPQIYASGCTTSQYDVGT